MAYGDFIAIKMACSAGNREEGWLAIVEGRGGCHETVDHLCETPAQAAEIGFDFAREYRKDLAEQQREMAQEAGMMHGIDVHNEMMGFD